MCKLSFPSSAIAHVLLFYIYFNFYVFIRLFFNPEENYPMMHEELMFPVLFVPVSVRVNGDEQTNVNSYYSQLF